MVIVDIHLFPDRKKWFSKNLYKTFSTQKYITY